jgi:hypothetical protein
MPAHIFIRLCAACGIAAALSITPAHADPLAVYELNTLAQYTRNEIENLKQWTARALQNCRTAPDFNRCADDVEYKRDQRAAEIMRDYDTQANQIYMRAYGGGR